MLNLNDNRIRLGSFALNILLLLLATLFGYLWWVKPCPPCYEAGKTVIVHDTIRPVDELKPIVVKVPEAFTKPKKKNDVALPKTGFTVVTADTTDKDFFVSEERATELSNCDSVRSYEIDTTEADNYHLKLSTTVTGKLDSWKLDFANLKPEIKTTETVVRRERWKFYVGGSFTINQREIKRCGVGVSALVTIPKIGGISYTFDAKNFAHIGTLYALIRFKK